MLVRDAVALGAKMDASRHRHTKRCRCDTCLNTRDETGCAHPHKCFERARNLLNALHDKWNPTKFQPEDEEEELEPLTDTDDNTTEFDRDFTTRGTIADTFRIFTGG
ncbi:hypothetical protein C8R43DRAFT_893549, partial [Mycena crocata]